MIQDWLGGFLAILSETFPPHDWPPLGTDAWDVFFEDFRKAFARNGVSVAEAEEARSLLAENPPRFKADYIPKVLGAVKIARELAGPSAAAGPLDDRESALHASKACIQCFGDGLAIVYASKPSVERRIAETSAAYCVCPYGQWIEKTHREKSPDVHKRIPHMANVIAGRSFWRLDPPGYEGLVEHDRPATGAGDLIRAWTAAVAKGPAPAPVATPRKPEWAAPIPADLPRPKAVPRLAPPPEPAPEIVTAEQAEWM